MNRFYVIVPVVLIAIFGGIYWQHSRTAAADAAAKAVEVTRLKAEEEAKKEEAGRKAREDAAARAAARAAEEKRKEEEIQAKWESDSAKIAADTALYKEQAVALTRDLAVLEKERNEVRSSKKAVSDESFDLARKVELTRIAKRAAEMEVQRTTEILIRKATPQE